MIYDSLDKLPVVTYYRILDSNNLQLLIKKSTNISELELQDIWEKLQTEFQEKEDSFLAKKIFMLTKNFEYYIFLHQFINETADALRYKFDEELVNSLRSHGYKIDKDHYLEDLQRIRIESEGLLIKAKHFKSQIPIEDDNRENISIEDVLTIFSSVLGYSIGSYRKITCMEYLSLKKQVQIKVKHQEKELQNLKNRQK